MFQEWMVFWDVGVSGWGIFGLRCAAVLKCVGTLQEWLAAAKYLVFRSRLYLCYLERVIIVAMCCVFWHGIGVVSQ
ncbi:hypothetical protein DF22_001975 [Xylella fastidiosa]|nr:hypothetical protein M233_00315 [Xylella fastidiosa subsp. multiplex Griffin-1]EWG15074.1 hypothetical protein P910_001373 [Xylella fastidiosa Mul-MD]KFA41396.1 hypothetical protein DF22_001975 [Xylella fastidiosa]OMK01078.1 hypothetical protein XYFPCFBP8417_01475 [Xylella fastidiosa subsp. multiplex]